MDPMEADQASRGPGSTPLKTRERLADPRQKRELNRQLFGVVAPRYDAVTRVLSFDRDRVWMKRMVDALPRMTGPFCLDLACGTGDISFRLAWKYPDGLIIGLDLCEAMLERARAHGTASHLRFQLGDMGSTGLERGSVDIVTGGYALRNAGDLGEVLGEIHRVLKSGGTGCFLDFSKPPGRSLQIMENLLLKAWGALWGWVFHGDPEVYAYIAESLARFPDRQQLADLFRSQGFEVQSSTLYFFGIVQCIMVRKPAPSAPDTFLQPTVEPTEAVGQHERHAKEAGAEDEHVRGFA
jgi:demethylmenaquinone methyltransferase/2-methoxy-6-polyprenyl-1,4-benzoquinol methylase